MAKQHLTKYLIKLSFLLFVFIFLSSFPHPFNHNPIGTFPVFPVNSADLPIADAAASEGRSSLPRWPHEQSDLKPDPALRFGTLPNGFKYILMKNDRPMDRVSLHMHVNAGSMQESNDQRGLAHFLEHMLFNGSTHFKPGELVQYFQSIGMEFGPDANARTGFDETVYDFLLPDGSQKSLEDAFVVIKDFAEGALLLEPEVDQERRIVLAEKRSRDSADYRTFVSTLAFEFPKARISRRLPIGDEGVLKSAGREDLKAFYDTWYRPENILLIIVGDFDESIAERLVKKMFGTLSPRAISRPEPDFGDIDHRGIQTFYHFENEAGQATITLEVIRKIDPIADSMAFQRKMLMNHLANRMVQHRLDALIRRSDTPFTSATINSGIFLKQIESAEITADCSPKNWQKALELLEQTLRSAIDLGFHDSEFKRVNENFLAEMDKAVNQAQTRESQFLALQIMRHISQNRVFMSPVQERELYAPMIAALSPKAVHRAFRKTWQADHRLILLTGNADLSQKDSSPQAQIFKAFSKSTKVAVAQPKDVQSVTFPYLPDPETKGTIADRKDIADLGIIQVQFGNGVRLNIKKTDFKADEVLVHLSFGAGRSAEPKTQPGLAILSTMLVNESGLGSLDKDELELALTGKRTTVLFGVGEDEFFYKGSTVVSEVPFMFQLLYAYINDPGCRKEAHTLSMERFMQRYQSLSRSIEGGMPLYGERFFAGGDSRFGLPPVEEFKKLTLDQVRSWVGSALKNSDMELSVVGDIDIDEIIQYASVYLGTLSKRKGNGFKKIDSLPRFPASRSLSVSVLTEIPKGMVVIGFPSEDIWDISRTRRLSILSRIFSEKLRIHIREELGASYSPFAVNRPSRTYPGFGYMEAFVNVDPQNGDRVIKEVMHIAKDLAEKGVSHKMMRQALEPTLTGIKDQLRDNDYWLNTVLSGSARHEEQIDWSRTIMSDYASIKAEELSVFARKYLDRRKAAVIKIMPKADPSQPETDEEPLKTQ